MTVPPDTRRQVGKTLKHNALRRPGRNRIFQGFAYLTKCTQCGNDASLLQCDIFTGACRKCQKAGARPASLGCGTLILIAIIVGLVSSSLDRDVSRIRRDLSDLQAAVERLESTNAEQLEEIRALREAFEAWGGD
ncbi:MAG: hypothetical protein MUO50_15380 [Longimicrobiales bacterium]|nr:hypothetical protein [Longimicrobiales bacterium]